MFKKITFENKLGIDSRDKKWMGLKVCSVSILVTLAGVLLTVLGFREIGYWTVVLSFLGTVIGLGIHFNTMFSQYSKTRH